MKEAFMPLFPDVIFAIVIESNEIVCQICLFATNATGNYDIFSNLLSEACMQGVAAKLCTHCE